MTDSGLLPPHPCNGASLRRASRRVSQLYDAVMAPCGLRGTQRSILAQIARDTAPSMGDLARALVLDRSALAHNLKPLERDGLVEVVVNPEDRRGRVVRLTEAGQTKLTESKRFWAEAQARFETVFGLEDSARLRQLLAQIASEDFAEAFTQAAVAPAERDRPTR